jgi:hypothetical protein
MAHAPEARKAHAPEARKAHAPSHNASGVGRTIPGLEALAPTAARPPRVVRDCGEIGMRIAACGTWHYQGGPIGRKELVCLFAGVLRREADGSFWLVTPAERARITVDDAPFVAVELFHCPGTPDNGFQQAISFRTNVDQVVTAGPSHPIRIARPPGSDTKVPYVMVRDGLEARINRAVYYELVALAVPESIGGARVLGIWSRGIFFPLGDHLGDHLGDVA